MQRLPLFLAMLGCVFLAGCKNTGTPRLVGMPPAWYQQQRAQVFDPYPQPSTSMDGNGISDVRPRDFNAPSAEVKRSQTSPFARFQRFLRQ